MREKTKRLAFLGLATALAMVFSYIEVILPPIWSAVPGIKVGLANIIIIFLLSRMSFKEAAVVSFIRILLTALLFGNPMTLAYSIAGAVLSLATMTLLKKWDVFSMTGVSIAGGVTHNLGQILVAMFVLQTREIAYYMIILAITGTVAGVFIGLGGALLLKYTKKWKQVADEYYDKITKYEGIAQLDENYYSSDDLHTFVSNMKINWE